MGAVAAGCGLAATFVPLAAIGALLLGAGVWNLRRASITGVIVDGAAMILSGAFLCLAWLWLEETRASGVGKWIFAGLIQIGWGIRRLALYRTARIAANDLQAIAYLESIVGRLSKCDPRTDPSVVEFRTGGMRRRRNRLGLYAEGTIGLLGHQAVRLERRADVWIEVRGTTALGRSVKVAIQMSDLKLTGEMTVGHYERFQQWKLGQSPAASIAA